ncbi:retrovirus-related pol polyprotein from transposon TNT 1-94 [Tanacetum coccineum]
MAFGGNKRDLGSFREETDKITDLHQIHEEVLFTERGDSVACIKRRRRDLSSDGVRHSCTGHQVLFYCLIGSIYKIIAKILANRLSLVIPDLINEVQTAFVPNRQILDGPFILNDLISWCKHKKVNVMIFKVDFEKAFDSVRWEYLDDILKSFGFGDTSRSWISGCLNFAKGSVLINGRPTSEFQFHKGLKQGDTLSSFLFILSLQPSHQCKYDCKSTSGGLQFLGEKLMSWSSKKQDCTTMSTAEAEYVSLFACCAQVIWMQIQLLDYGYKYNRIPMYYDSKSAIAISCNPVQHSRTKHIDIQYHFIKEHFEKGMMELYFVGTEYQLTDLFTKALSKELFEYLVHHIGMRCMTPTQLKSMAKLSS